MGAKNECLPGSTPPLINNSNDKERDSVIKIIFSTKPVRERSFLERNTNNCLGLNNIF